MQIFLSFFIKIKNNYNKSMHFLSISHLILFKKTTPNIVLMHRNISAFLFQIALAK